MDSLGLQINFGSRRAAQPEDLMSSPHQLRGYQKVFLNPGESKQVSVALAPQAFAYWDTSRNAWTPAAGTYQVLVGGSSRNLPLIGAMRPLSGANP